MLKGYTKIELTNVHTGEKEVVEKHNIITNFLNDYVAFSGMINDQGTIRKTLCPLYNIGMGGIQLFKDQLPEDANSYLVDYETPDVLTGCATNTNFSTTDVKVGSKNLTESCKIENGYKHVWDFSTSQANGDISAVGLCHANAAVSRGSAMATFKNIGNFSTLTDGLNNLYINHWMVDYDFEKNIITTIQPTNTSSSTNTTVILRKIRLNLEQIKLFDKNNTNFNKNISFSYLNEKQEKTLPGALPTEGTWKNGYDGYYYYIYLYGNSSKIARINQSTLEPDMSYGIKTFTANISSSDKYGNDRYTAIADGFLLFFNNNKTVKKMNLLNVSDSTLISTSFSDITGRMRSDGKKVYINGNILYPDGKIVAYNQYLKNGLLYTKSTFDDVDTGNTYDYGFSVIKDGKYIIADYPTDTGVGLNFGIMLNQLCTINNLEETVTKTPDKTMKITYTITEVEDE